MLGSRLRAVGVVFVVLLSALALGVPVGTSTAADPVTEIDSCTVITDPGRYELTADVGDTSLDARGCIEIRAGNVTLEGNGHTVGPGRQESVFVGTAPPFSAGERLPNVTVRNVVATADVEFYRTPGATIRDVTVRDAYLLVKDAPETTIENNTLLGTGERGASVSLFRSNRSTVADNTVENSDQHGADRSGVRLLVTDGVTVRGNTVRSSSRGLFVGATRNAVVSNNSISGSSRSAIWVERGSSGNRFRANSLRDSAQGVTVDASTREPDETIPPGNNTFVNTTATNISGWAFSAPGNETNRVEDLDVGSATVSFSGQGVRVRGVDSSPAVPPNLADVDSFVEVEGIAPVAWARLDVSYDQATVERGEVNESALRVYRRDGTSVYAPLAPRDEADDADTGSWSTVPGTNGVETSANHAYANLTFPGVGEPVLEFAGEPTTERVDVRARSPDDGKSAALYLHVRSPALNSDYVRVTERNVSSGELTTVSLSLPEWLPFTDEEGEPLPEVEVTVSLVTDTNGDGTLDFDKVFPDGDDDRAVREISTTITFPVDDEPTDPDEDVTDTDGDGLSDFSEETMGTDPDNDDTDGDGLTDGAEIGQYHSSPRATDTDDDGLDDGEEVNTHATDPADWDTDDDGYADGTEVGTCGSDPTDPSDP